MAVDQSIQIFGVILVFIGTDDNLTAVQERAAKISGKDIKGKAGRLQQPGLELVEPVIFSPGKCSVYKIAVSYHHTLGISR